MYRGHDFRPDYAKLHILRTAFPRAPLMLLTATANPSVRRDLVDMLHLGDATSTEGDFLGVVDCRQEVSRDRVKGLKIFLGDFDRPNLTFEVWRKPSDFTTAVNLVVSALNANVPHSHGAAIVYCFSQKECVDVAQELSHRGVSASPYHAGSTLPSCPIAEIVSDVSYRNVDIRNDGGHARFVSRPLDRWTHFCDLCHHCFRTWNQHADSAGGRAFHTVKIPRAVLSGSRLPSCRHIAQHNFTWLLVGGTCRSRQPSIAVRGAVFA